MNDFDLEEHMIVVDNLDHTNKTDFTAHLPVALGGRGRSHAHRGEHQHVRRCAKSAPREHR